MARRSPAIAAKRTASKAFLRHRLRPPLWGTSPCGSIVAAAQNGDPRALAHWRHFIDAFARSPASVINILDPQVIVLGGGLSNVSQIYRDLPAAIVPWISDTCRTQIKPARFGDASGARRGPAARLPGAAQGQR